jgi:hypothetical protein
MADIQGPVIHLLFLPEKREENIASFHGRRFMSGALN